MSTMRAATAGRASREYSRRVFGSGVADEWPAVTGPAMVTTPKRSAAAGWGPAPLGSPGFDPADPQAAIAAIRLERAHERAQQIGMPTGHVVRGPDDLVSPVPGEEGLHDVLLVPEIPL